MLFFLKREVGLSIAVGGNGHLLLLRPKLFLPDCNGIGTRRQIADFKRSVVFRNRK